MVIRVDEFSREGYKISKFFFAKNQDSKRKIIVFWVVKMCKTLTFSQFSTSKIKGIFQKINFIKKLLGAHFLTTSIFMTLYLLKWCPIFDDSSLHQFNKYNNFLAECWFLTKNVSNFVSLPLKLDNPYYHQWACLRTLFSRVLRVQVSKHLWWCLRSFR